MDQIRSFRDLKVWQKAMDAAVVIFNATKTFPTEERYSLVDQIRRSSRSVAANVSEAWRARRYPASFVSKLNIAESEAAETQTHIELSRRCGYLTDDVAAGIDVEYELILAMLSKMAMHPEQWELKNK